MTTPRTTLPETARRRARKAVRRPDAADRSPPRRSRATQATLVVLLLASVLQLGACGTLIYPERRGQDGGDIDAMVVLLDGVGVLFWVIPGLAAFIVDFATGAIYEPGLDLHAPVPWAGEQRTMLLPARVPGERHASWIHEPAGG